MNKSACGERRSIAFTVLTLLAAGLFIQMGLLTNSSCVATETTIDNSRSAEIQTPVFSIDGRIVCGDKSIWQKKDYAQLLMCIDNDAICKLIEIFNLGKGDIGPVFFMNKKAELIGNSEVYTADVKDAISSDKKLGTYRLSMSLLEDGLIRAERDRKSVV